MTIQTINIGNVVNDGLGDDLRTAFQKVNANFTELNASLTVTASNISTSGVGIFKEKNGLNLEFKRIRGDSPISVIESVDNNSVIVNYTWNRGVETITADSGSINAELNNGNLRIIGSDNISVSAFDNTGTIIVDTKIDLDTVLRNIDFGPLVGNFSTEVSTNPIQLALQASNIDFGLFNNPGTFNLDLGSI